MAKGSGQESATPAKRIIYRTRELVEYVEAEKSLQERRRERENANLWTRAKWWVAGYPDDEG